MPAVTAVLVAIVVVAIRIVSIGHADHPWLRIAVQIHRSQ
jgi:hypothetical protein